MFPIFFESLTTNNFPRAEGSSEPCCFFALYVLGRVSTKSLFLLGILFLARNYRLKVRFKLFF
jgi:hypothetical protein